MTTRHPACPTRRPACPTRRPACPTRLPAARHAVPPPGMPHPPPAVRKHFLRHHGQLLAEKGVAMDKWKKDYEVASR
jgi:hypothetical protein